MNVGNRVFLEHDLLSAKVAEGFRALPTANVADTMERSCVLSSQVHLASSPRRPIMADAVLTVRTRPDDNLVLHKTLGIAGSDDVTIVSNEGGHTHSLTGEIMVVYA